jgi:hypothetical protein
MKPIKLKIVIFAGVIVVCTCAVVISLLNRPKPQNQCNLSATVSTTENPRNSRNPRLLSLVKTKLPAIKKTDDANAIDIRRPIKPVLTASAPAQKQKAYPWSSLVQSPASGNQEMAPMAGKNNGRL